MTILAAVTEGCVALVHQCTECRDIAHRAWLVP